MRLGVVCKTPRGDWRPQDWDRLQQRARTVNMVFDNGRVFTILMYYVRNGVDLDKAELLEKLSILAERGNLGPFNLAAIGYLVMNDLDKPDLSLWYFTRRSEEHTSELQSLMRI